MERVFGAFVFEITFDQSSKQCLLCIRDNAPLLVHHTATMFQLLRRYESTTALFPIASTKNGQ